ncbi:response regulator transcription factor [Pedobacter boryungensis]|uniref:Response regulator n=1 Tax=Pedobacter boryungensis TaxID=869962 RepID=A0ABX2DBE3_9SPHI|nr:response regulator [Pedobacter boryungensis]NQX30651.1 response regulator [Pedobacter boryungensis]
MDKKKIYVVEDDNDISEMITILLTEEDLQVSTSANISDFRKLLDKELPDLILMDIMLPDGNGIEECKELKESNKLKSIPLILMSAHAQSKFVIEECPADGFIPKPFDIYDFMAQINHQLTKTS